LGGGITSRRGQQEEIATMAHGKEAAGKKYVNTIPKCVCSLKERGNEASFCERR